MSTVDGDGEDRISALPDEIIHQILSFMPIDSAIRTAILSKRWVHLWKFSPVIDFASLPISRTEPIDYGFVNRCLSLHRAPEVRKFMVIAEIGPYSNPDIENWIDFAVSRHVRFLEFYLMVQVLGSFRFFRLPNSFYIHKNTESIEHLVLSNVDYNPPPPPVALGLGFRGFASLRKLFLYESTLTDEALEATMSTCCVLESLTLIRCFGLVDIKISGLALKELVIYPDINQREELPLQIDAPNLVTLKTWRSVMVTRFRNSCHRLVEATLFNPMIQKDDAAAIGYVRTLIGQLAQLEFLATNYWILQFVAKEHYMNGSRCTTFKNLKEFYFLGGFVKEYDIVLFLAFLEDCPVLEKIQIDCQLACRWLGVHKNFPGCDVMRWLERPLGRMTEFIELVDGEGDYLHVGLLPQLKSIELLFFSGFKSEMELVKRLLQKAVNLETMSLIFEDPEHFVLRQLRRYNVSLHERELLREKVSLLPRASPNAQFLLG